MRCFSQKQKAHVANILSSQFARYIVNGVIATSVHFAVLSFNLHILMMSSAGVANFCAAVVGITTSFLGSRYFVFGSRDEKILHEASRFVLLYASIAVLHGLVLFVWSDISHFDYRIGFLIATLLQVSFSYWGNKTLVFKL